MLQPLGLQQSAICWSEVWAPCWNFVIVIAFVVIAVDIVKVIAVVIGVFFCSCYYDGRHYCCGHHVVITVVLKRCVSFDSLWVRLS